MNNRFILKVFYIAVIFLVAASAYSRRKIKKEVFEWQDVTEAEWNMVEDSSQNIFNAAMIYEKIEVDDNKMSDEKCYRTLYRRIRIFNEKGRKWGDVEVPYVSFKQEIEDIQGRTVLPDGTIIELEDQHIFEKEIVKGKGGKFTQYTFSMPGITDDCIIEYMIKYCYEFPVGTWIIQKEIVLSKGEYRWKFYTGKYGLGMALAMIHFGLGTPNFLWLNCGPDKSVTHLPSLKESKEMFFEISNVPPLEEEPYMVPSASVRSKLICYYGSEGSPASYWGDGAVNIGKWSESFCKKNKQVKEVVESFGDLSTDAEKIASAYNWVQDSLVNLDFDEILDDKGKQKKTKDNETADDVIKHGYGTQEDISLIFFDMLREMNIDAKIAYARDRIDDLFVYEAKFWQFDASFVAIPNEQNSYDFYAPGHIYAELGMVPWFYEGVNTLLAGANINFCPIPFTSPEKNTVNRYYELQLNDDLEISGRISTRLTGQDARELRIILHDEDSSAYEELMREEYKELFAGATLDSFTIENRNNINEPLKLSSNVEYAALTTQGNRLLLKPFDYFTEAENPFYAQERKQAILFEHSFQLREGAQFQLPEGWSIEAMPNDTIFANLAGECSAQFTNFGNTVSIQRFFTLKAPFWRLDQFPVVKELFQMRQDLNELIIVLIETE